MFTSASPRFIPFKGGFYQVRIKPCVGLPEPLHRLWQIQHSPRRRLLKQSNRSNDRESAMNGGAAPGAVVH